MKITEIIFKNNVDFLFGCAIIVLDKGREVINMNLIETFLQAKRDNLASDLTIKNYRIDLNQFVPLVFNKSVDEVSIDDLKEITILKTRDTLLKLQADKKYTVTTINRRMASFRSLVRYYSVKYGFPNNIHDMKPFNDTRLKEVEFIENDDVKKITEKAKRTSPRMYLIMGLLFNTGLRSAELLSLKIENVHEDCIIVEGKGGKMRKVDLNSIAKDCLKTYLGTIDRKSGNVLDMQYATLRRHYTKFLKQFDIDCSRLHTSRKSFASNLIAKGGTLTDVSQLLGHSTTSTLEKHYLGSNTKKITVSLLE